MPNTPSRLPRQTKFFGDTPTARNINPGDFVFGTYANLDDFFTVTITEIPDQDEGSKAGYVEILREAHAEVAHAHDAPAAGAQPRTILQRAILI